LGLVGFGWVWLGLVGFGWVWLGLVGFSWVWFGLVGRGLVGLLVYHCITFIYVSKSINDINNSRFS
jgi:hypothetical protein